MFTRYFKRNKGCKEISLIVDDRTSAKPFVVKVPKRLLVENSAVFRKMYENGYFKKSREVKLKEVTPTGLEKVVEYIGKESVYFQNHCEAIDALKVAYVYQIPVMNNVCADFLTTIIDSMNVCEIYEFASSFAFHTLEYHCLKYLDEHAEEVLNSPGFLTLKKATVLEIVKRHTLNIPNEIMILRRILTWGLNDCIRRGADAEKADEFVESVKSLIERVRFLTMSEQELQDPEVDKFYRLVHPEDSSSKRKSLLNLELRSRSSTGDSFSFQPRSYQMEYIHDLEVYNRDDHPVKSGESFCLRIEVLKGRVFLTAVTLAFDTFVTMKNAACLFVTMSATNVQTSEQKAARGTFLNTAEDAELKFPSPLMAKESEVLEVTLNVKRAENICPMVVRSDIQIAMPDTKDIAMKMTPNVLTSESIRSLFKNVRYFF